MNRREFLGTGAGLMLSAFAARTWSADREKLQVVTVEGAISPEDMGRTLVHEHVLVDFIGADAVSRDRYDRQEVFRSVLPHLKRVKELGCRTLIECTPNFLGRDPALLKRLAVASGVRILTNTGYYGARQGKFLPPHAFKDKPEELAARWLKEWKQGIEDTGIRPGFIKIGVDAGPLTEVNRKLVRAAARTHLDSGLTIAAHTGDGTAALEELKVLREEGVEGSAFIWVHAQNERDTALHARAAEQGAWIEFDGISPQTLTRHVDLVKDLKSRGYLGQVLLSHDAGWYHVGEPGGGKFRPYDTLFTAFLPALKEARFSPEEIDRFLSENPRRAFTIRVRARSAKG
jgi:phosphotriesterase-related protein